MEERHLAPRFSVTSHVQVAVIQSFDYPFKLLAQPLRSTAPRRAHDKLTSRNDAARVFSVRTRDRTPRSERLSNATERILRDDPASLKGWARPYSHKSL
jgi:hypothetical protein